MGFNGERDVHGHLVAVEIRVVSGADERVDANRFAFNEDRLKRLNRKTVQGRSTIQHHGMAFGDLFEDIPDFRSLALDEFLGTANGMNVAKFLEAADDEWLEKHERHFLRQPALVELEFRPDDDDRTARVINALAEKVLTETAAFALEHVAKRLERAIRGTGYGATMASIVEKSIDRFLKHALFVTNDNLGGFELQQCAKTIVAVDNPAIEIIEIGCGETTTLKWNERAEIRRNDGQHTQDHPLGARI